MTTATIDATSLMAAKLKLYVAVVALGIVVTSFAGFGLVRSVIFRGAVANPAVQPADGVPQATPQPFHAAPNVQPWQGAPSGEESTAPADVPVDLVPVPTAAVPWPTFDPNVPVVSDYEVVIPNGNAGITQRAQDGFVTHSGLKGGK